MLVAIVLFGSGASGYQVKARFINAGQLVKGNPVTTGGVPIGSVKKIKITDDGQAEISMKIDGDHSPLREGTRATIRQFSQSGLANRYIDLTLPPNGSRDIPDGGLIDSARTTTAVDIDELFNTLDPPTRRALQKFFKNQARQFRGKADLANTGWQYLNPNFATSSRLFRELTRDEPTLKAFLVQSAKLLTALAEKKQDLSELIPNLNDTFRALGDQKRALYEAVVNLPPFMRQANTTFVNLRAALDDLDPLVDASIPVARRLRPFLRQTRRFAHDARPTVRDFSLAIQRRGRDNDLINFLATVPSLYDIALVQRDRSVSPGGHSVSVGNVQGAFPSLVKAFQGGTPETAFARPYTTDLMGWFDDFSTTGPGFDAIGSIAKAHNNVSENLPPNPGVPVAQNQYKRCPGGAEAAASDGSNVLSSEEEKALDCRNGDRAVQSYP
ncbi:MAG: MlaD family protein [Thermoleophilaceae bacterium]